MRWASHASTNETLDIALDECAESVLERMGSKTIDLAIVFLSSHHLKDPANIPNLLQQKFRSKHVVGCSAGGVIGGGKEIEQSPGVSVTCGHLPGVNLTPFHINNDDLPDLDASPESWENMTRTWASNNPQFIILSDPFTIKSENLLMGLDYAFPKSVKIGGLASGSHQYGGNVLILNSNIYEQGAIGIALEGKIRIDTIVDSVPQSVIIDYEKQEAIWVWPKTYSYLSVPLNKESQTNLKKAANEAAKKAPPDKDIYKFMGSFVGSIKKKMKKNVAMEVEAGPPSRSDVTS